MMDVRSLRAFWATYRFAPPFCLKGPGCHCGKRHHFYESLIKISRTPTLMRMPDEILCLIVEEVAQLDHKWAMNRVYCTNRYRERQAGHNNHPRRGQVDVEGQYALALTCRRFHRLVMPLLCGRAVLDSRDDFHHCVPQKHLFFNALDESPWLQLYITDLTVKWDGLARNFQEIRSLIRLPNLDRLTLDSVDLDASDLDLGPLPREKGTANVSTLRFLSMRAKPESIRRLLEWPRALHNLDIDIVWYDDDSIQDQPHSSYRSTDKLAHVLGLQRESLRTLKLECLQVAFQYNKITTWPYPKLHTLAISVTNQELRSDNCYRWISPSLRTLIFDVNAGYSRGDFRGTFRESDITWLLNHGCTAGLIKNEGGRQLERIGVRLFARGRSCREALFEKERTNMHEDNEKHRLVHLLEALQKYGVSTFWIGASGAEYTAREMRESCKCAECVP